MDAPEQPQLYLITPPEIELSRFPTELAKVLDTLRGIQADSKKDVSLADLIVLAGGVGIEKAAKEAGHDVTVPFHPGRTDATEEQTDVASFSLLEPKADAFRNYFNAAESYRSPTEMMIDRADQLNLTIPEMTVLLGGLRRIRDMGGS